MTDWLDETLDHDSGETVPDGFAARVFTRVREEAAREECADAQKTPTPSPVGVRALSFPSTLGIAAAAVLLLAVGFWLGHGAKAVEPTLLHPGSSQMATLELSELYSNRALLQDFDILSDAELELAFQDEAAKTWILDETSDVWEVPVAPGEEQ